MTLSGQPREYLTAFSVGRAFFSFNSCPFRMPGHKTAPSKEKIILLQPKDYTMQLF
jgi:hypothetical protein